MCHQAQRPSRTHILAFAGAKGSGKSVLAAWLERHAKELFPPDAVVRRYAFAEPLKRLCVDVLGLLPEQVYGTEEQKNTPTCIRWENVPGNTLLNRGRMTGRQVMQVVGTEVVRRLNPDGWACACLHQIDRDRPYLAVIDDLRFANEAECVTSAGGRVILLTRRPHLDLHPSEDALADQDADAVLYNDAWSLHETKQAVVSLLKEWQWAL